MTAMGEPDRISRLPIDELLRLAEAMNAAGWSLDNRSAICGCPLRADGTEPYLHLDGCHRKGDLQINRWLQERVAWSR